MIAFPLRGVDDYNKTMIAVPQKFRSPRRRWAFRLLAVLCALLPFLVLEGAFAALGIGESDETIDPFVGFSDVVPLFELNPELETYVLSPKRFDFFAPEMFPARKGKDTFRIFCLGGSTVQGRPYSIETSFTTWLRLALEKADASRKWEVINCGGISYASYRLTPILEECLAYEPDMFILCTGHNEFLEDRSYSHVKMIPDSLATPAYWLSKSRIVNMASQMLEGRDRTKPVLTTDADAMLDYQNGIDAYHRDPDWHRAVAVHFKTNLQAMIRKSREAKIPILIMQPLSNLSGTPPFKSESGPLTEQESTAIGELIDEARRHYLDDLAGATQLWNQVCRADPLNARHWYEYGRCLEIQKRYDEAHRAYINARDCDICPLRMTSPLEDAMADVVKREKVPFLNLHAYLESKTATGILGDQWLVDHVHPNFEGHQQIGLELARWLERQGVVQLPKNWEADCQMIFNAYFESLDRMYFHRGQRMLDALREWTRGNADGPPVEERFPHRLQQSAE